MDQYCRGYPDRIPHHDAPHLHDDLAHSPHCDDQVPEGAAGSLLRRTSLHPGPHQADFLEGGLPDPGPYYYLIDDNDPDSGRGGDLDAFNENIPGNGSRPGKDVEFVVLRQYDHGDLARYVYVEDDDPPTVANATNDPRYDRHLPKASRS